MKKANTKREKEEIKENRTVQIHCTVITIIEMS